MAVTPNYGWPVPVATDYVKDGWEAISDLGNAIDTTVAGLGSGLTKITTRTMSASSGEVFTGLSAGSRYKILITAYNSVNNEQINMQFREGSTNKTSGYYGGGYYVGPTVNGIYNQANNAGFMNLCRANSSVDVTSFMTYDIAINPNGNQASISGLSMADSNFSVYLNYTNATMATCDGIYIYPPTGNFTGTATLYKYQD